MPIVTCIALIASGPNQDRPCGNPAHVFPEDAANPGNYWCGTHRRTAVRFGPVRANQCTAQVGGRWCPNDMLAHVGAHRCETHQRRLDLRRQAERANDARRDVAEHAERLAAAPAVPAVPAPNGIAIYPAELMAERAVQEAAIEAQFALHGGDLVRMEQALAALREARRDLEAQQPFAAPQREVRRAIVGVDAARILGDPVRIERANAVLLEAQARLAERRQREDAVNRLLVALNPAVPAVPAVPAPNRVALFYDVAEAQGEVRRATAAVAAARDAGDPVRMEEAEANLRAARARMVELRRQAVAENRLLAAQNIQPPQPPQPQLARVAEDRQNVHTAVVVQQTNANIKALLKRGGDNKGRTIYPEQIVGYWLMKKLLRLDKVVALVEDIRRFYNLPTIYNENDALYRRVFNAIGKIAIDEDIADKTRERGFELMKRLYEECSESVGLCAEGHMGRLANAFVGFFDDLSPPVPVGEILQQKIGAISALDVSAEEKLRMAGEVFAELKVPEAEQVPWREALVG